MAAGTIFVDSRSILWYLLALWNLDMHYTTCCIGRKRRGPRKTEEEENVVHNMLCLDSPNLPDEATIWLKAEAENRRGGTKRNFKCRNEPTFSFIINKMTFLRLERTHYLHEIK